MDTCETNQKISHWFPCPVMGVLK
ncbi:hypothetical protein NC652_036866 [Populus alba x Populus x berolinensis]|nr:hypothetical protein NC652_036866 [Populus alba x Populus x berolinensis]